MPVEHKEDHNHNHSHHHHVSNYNALFFAGILLNLSFVIIEFIAGFGSDSLALISDASHNLGDVGSLILAWGAFWLSNRKASSRFTFGFKKSSIISALINGLTLSVLTGALLLQAFQRLLNPTPVQTELMIWVAAIGILVNAFTAFLFSKDAHKDLNLKGAFWHMLADALVSAGVVAAGVLIHFTGVNWIDPAVSLVICAVILWGSWGLLKESLKLVMNAVPSHIDPLKVKQSISEIPSVVEVHDLHIWAMSSNDVALSAHVVIKQADPENRVIQAITQTMNQKYHIHHSTVQIEVGNQYHCDLKTDGA